MTLSMQRRKKASHDAIITDHLKKLEHISAPLFFIIPLCLALIGGKNLALWTMIIWPLFCILYIVFFHLILRRYTTPEMRKSSVLSKQYIFYQMSWLILIFLFLFFVTLVVQTAR